MQSAGEYRGVLFPLLAHTTILRHSALVPHRSDGHAPRVRHQRAT